MKKLMLQSEIHNLQHDFYDDLGEAINNYYRTRLGIMIDNGLNPNDINNSDIDDIRAVYDRWRTKRPF
jgi:hypothetical protein